MISSVVTFKIMTREARMERICVDVMLMRITFVTLSGMMAMLWRRHVYLSRPVWRASPLHALARPRIIRMAQERIHQFQGVSFSFVSALVRAGDEAIAAARAI